MLRRFPLIIILIVLLTGCGFHLRQNTIELSTKYPEIVLPPTGSHSLHQALSRALISSSIHVLPIAPNHFAPTLIVQRQEFTQQPLVYGTDAELRRERLRLTIGFSFQGKTTKDFVLFAERDRQLNSKQHLGDNAEKILIEQEMQADIISQLLRFLDNELTGPPHALHP